MCMFAKMVACSGGFRTAHELSRKVVRLFKLASEQLSKQRHYDFGLRALKSVVALAWELARAHPMQAEDEVLVRALLDANAPKLVANDLELFHGIVHVRSAT